MTALTYGRIAVRSGHVVGKATFINIDDWTPAALSGVLKLTALALIGFGVSREFTSQVVSQPEFGVQDALHALLRDGARGLIAQAVEAELQALLDRHAGQRLADGRQAVVRNGHLPERTVQTGLGDVPVKVPKVRDRSGSGIKFNSAFLPPYLKRAKSIEELLPWLCCVNGACGVHRSWPSVMAR